MNFGGTKIVFLEHSVKIQKIAITQISCEIKFQKDKFTDFGDWFGDISAQKMCKNQPNWFHVKPQS